MRATRASPVMNVSAYCDASWSASFWLEYFSKSLKKVSIASIPYRLAQQRPADLAVEAVVGLRLVPAAVPQAQGTVRQSLDMGIADHLAVPRFATLQRLNACLALPGHAIWGSRQADTAPLAAVAA